MNQSAEERLNLKRNFDQLHKVKTTMYEIDNFDGTQVVISKTDKKIVFVERLELRWESCVDKQVMDRYNEII